MLEATIEIPVGTESVWQAFWSLRGATPGDHPIAYRDLQDVYRTHGELWFFDEFQHLMRSMDGVYAEWRAERLEAEMKQARTRQQPPSRRKSRA